MNCLFLLRHSPYGSSLAREALDMVLAFAAFGHTVRIVFIGDGVYQLLDNQDTTDLQQKNISKTLTAFSLYDINDVFIDRASIQQRGLEHRRLAITARNADSHAIQQLIQEADSVISL